MNPADTRGLEAAQTADEAEFLRQALDALPLCIQHCCCADHWHLLWAGLKATGVLRGLHAQRPFLIELIRRHQHGARRTTQVLIAGAADAASLQLLHMAIDDRATRYHLVDRCKAPLELARRAADAGGLELLTDQGSLDAAAGGEPWDLVFIHYTLGFMDAAARQRLLARLHQGLARGGVVICAVRERQAAGEPDAAAPLERWTREADAALRATFGAHPQLLAPLLDHLDVYARARQARESAMPSFEQVAGEFAAAGFEQLEAHRNPGRPPARASDLSPPGSITPWVAVFAALPG